MIAVQLMNASSLRCAPNHSVGAVEPEGEHSGGFRADRPTNAPTRFQPLEPGLVSEAIPAFYIGRNKQGFWVARDAKGQSGGIFLLENSALAFARRISWPMGCATIFLSEVIELDLENQGNPFVAQLGWLKSVVMQSRRRMVAFIGNLTEAVKRRSKDVH